MTYEFKDFMATLFTAQEIEQKKEHNKFKEHIHELIKDGMRSEMGVATKPLKENQEKIMKDHETLMKKIGELEKRVEDIDKKGL